MDNLHCSRVPEPAEDEELKMWEEKLKTMCEEVLQSLRLVEEHVLSEPRCWTYEPPENYEKARKSWEEEYNRLMTIVRAKEWEVHLHEKIKPRALNGETTKYDPADYPCVETIADYEPPRRKDNDGIIEYGGCIEYGPASFTTHYGDIAEMPTDEEIAEYEAACSKDNDPSESTAMPIDEPSPPRSRSRSPSKRRDVSGLQLPPVQKRLRFAGIDDDDEPLQPKVHASGVPSPPISVNAGPTCEGLKSMSIAEAKSAKKEKPLSFIEKETVWDEETSHCEPSCKNMAKRVVRRHFYGVKYQSMPDAQKIESDIEFTSDLDILDFINITHGLNLGSILPLCRLASRNLVKERSETFHFLVRHPWYLEQATDHQLLMVQDLVELFNRRFTWGVATIRGLSVPLSGSLLKLGDYGHIQAGKGHDTGGNEREWEATNEAAWLRLLAVGEPADPMKIWKYGHCDYASTDFRQNLGSKMDAEEELPTYESIVLEKEVKEKQEQVSEDPEDPILSCIDDEPYTVITPARESEDFVLIASDHRKD